MRAAEIMIADTHISHKTALMYPKNDADYKPNKPQKWLFKTWCKFLEDIERVLDEYKPDYVHLSMLGDMGDTDFKNRAPHEFWTRDPSEIKTNAVNLFQPLVKLVDNIHAVRGTLAHVGEDGGIDEQIAAEYADQTDPRTGNKIADGILINGGKFKATQYAEFVLSGVMFDIAHHGRNRSKWTRSNGLNSLREEIVLSRTRTGDPVPDVIERGHFHFSDDTSINTRPYVVAVASWMLPNNFIYRIDPTVSTPSVGGHVMIVEDGDILRSKPLTYQFPRKKAVTLCK